MSPIERVVVPLDAASEVRAVLDAAARLAAHARARLHGVFVEDEDLLRLAGLPFARQTILGVRAEPMTAAQIALHLRVAALQMREALAAAARQYALEWSFEVMRGAAEHALALATARDLVVAGAVTRPVARYFRVASRWLGSAGAVPGPLLLVRTAAAGEGGVVMLLRDCKEGSARLLEAAARIAEARSVPLTVVASRTSAAAVPGLQQWLAGELARFELQLKIEIEPDEPLMLHRRIIELDCRLLAVAAAEVEGTTGRLREWIEDFSGDVLIVR
ncbi:MAG: hypothetical protein ACREE2_06975 [Stellaceae bacterium]